MTLESSLTYTKGEGREFVHDKYKEVYLARGFARKINSGRLSVEDVWRDYWSYEEDAELWDLPKGIKWLATLPSYINVINKACEMMTAKDVDALSFIIMDYCEGSKKNRKISHYDPYLFEYNNCFRIMRYSECSKKQYGKELMAKLLQFKNKENAGVICVDALIKLECMNFYDSRILNKLNFDLIKNGEIDAMDRNILDYIGVCGCFDKNLEHLLLSKSSAKRIAGIAVLKELDCIHPLLTMLLTDNDPFVAEFAQDAIDELNNNLTERIIKKDSEINAVHKILEDGLDLHRNWKDRLFGMDQEIKRDTLEALLQYGYFNKDINRLAAYCLQRWNTYEIRDVFTNFSQKHGSLISEICNRSYEDPCDSLKSLVATPSNDPTVNCLLFDLDWKLIIKVAEECTKYHTFNPKLIDFIAFINRKTEMDRNKQQSISEALENLYLLVELDRQPNTAKTKYIHSLAELNYFDPNLAQLIHDPDVFVKEAAITAYGKLQEYNPSLMELRDHKHELIRNADFITLIKLGMIKEDKAIEQILRKKPNLLLLRDVIKGINLNNKNRYYILKKIKEQYGLKSKYTEHLSNSIIGEIVEDLHESLIPKGYNPPIKKLLTE